MSTFKRIGSFALALIMVCSLIYVGPIEAAAVETAETCPHCGVAMSEITWTEWIPTSGCSITESGHYYMSADFDGVNSQLKIGISGDTENVADVVLDLRGNILKSPSTRVFAVYPSNTLSVMDTVGGGEIQGSIYGKSQNGCTIRVDKDATFHLYSGTLRDITTGTRLGYGGVIGSEGGNINIHGGTVCDGSAVLGGNIWVRNGALNITGGTISNGVALNEAANPTGGNIHIHNSNFTMTGGTVTGGTASSEAMTPAGGNIYIGNTAGTQTASITGGTVENGTATNGNGGNIYVNTGILDIGGTAKITGGHAQRGVARTNGGGNIYCQLSVTLNISGGEIKNGTSVDSYGGNILCRGTLTMTNGTITGGTALNGGNLFLSGFDNLRENTISGGTISDGTATTGKIDRVANGEGFDGDNIYVLSTALTISGGTITDNDGGNAILVHSHTNTLSKEENPWGAIVNLNIEEGSDLANALSGKVYLVNDAELNTTFGEVLYKENGESIWNATVHTHEWVSHEAVAPSCHADGNIAYQQCSICGAAQTAGENPMPLSKNGWILAAAHTALEHHDAVEVTCDQDGHDAFDYCNDCQVFVYEDPLKLSYQDGVIPALGHTWVDHEAVAPTCNADGNIAYQQCSICGAAQTAGENPMPLGRYQWVLSATGEHSLEHHDAVAVTCTVNGHEAFDYCTSCECFFYEDPMKMTYQAGVILAPGHKFANGYCSVCYEVDPDYVPGEEPGEPIEIRFEFGANGSAAHVDGNSLGTSKTYTEGEYKLVLNGMSSVYGPAYDLKGNSCIKLGTSSKTAAFNFTVPEDVTEVVIYAAKYKANASTLQVNGTTYTLAKASNNGEYDEIVVDTSTTKTVSVATVSGGLRAMINTIVYKVAGGAADTSSKVVTNIGNKTFIVGEPQEFVFTTLANENAGVMVMATGTFSDASAVEKLEYYEPTMGQWFELDVDAGLELPMSLSNATFKFRVTFAKDGKFPFTVVMQNFATGEVLCSAEAVTNVNDPDGKVLTIAEAIAKGSAMAHDTYTDSKYTVTGVIKEVYQTTYGNMRIVDEEGNVLTIYGTYSADGSTRYDKLDVKPVAGETITIYGILGQYNGTAQIKNGWIVEHIHSVHTWVDYAAVEPTCDTEGNIAYQQCSVCGAAQTAGENPMPLGKFGWILAADHAWVEHEAVEPTCYTVGNIAYKQCSECGEAWSLGENPVMLSKDGWILGVKHAWVEHEAVEPTCTTEGNIAYKQCSECGEAWSLGENPVMLSKDGWILGVKHAWVEHEAVEPTCDTVGNIAYKQCSECGEAWSLGENPVMLSKDGWILGVKHNINHVEAKAATTEENGNVEYWYCEDCGYAWLDEAMTQVTNLLSVIIPKLEVEVLKGDMNLDGTVNNEDVVLLLWHTLFPEDYPLSAEVEADLTGNGKIDNEDVVLLLWHTLFPEDYPL